MTKLIKATQSLIIAASIVAGGAMQTSTASAASVSKPTVSAKGMFYKSKAKAKSSAKYRWGLKAASKYGAGFAHWGKAKGKNIVCGIPNIGKELYRCKATAKPTKVVNVCKSKVSASGMYYHKKSKAKSSSAYRWSLKVAANHGSSWAHFGKAKGKSYKCMKGQNKGLWNCTVKAKPCK